VKHYFFGYDKAICTLF